MDFFEYTTQDASQLVKQAIIAVTRVNENGKMMVMNAASVILHPIKRPRLTVTAKPQRRKPDICNECGALLRHSLGKPIGNSPFGPFRGRLYKKCDQRDFAFARAGHLKRHQLVYTGENPQKYSYCGTGITEAGSLKSHQLLHLGERPHKCVKCSSAFTTASQLKKHQIIHSGIRPHKRSLCESAFPTASQLEAHVLFHSIEKPHRCDQSESAFTLASQLKRHNLVYTEEKP